MAPVLGAARLSPIKAAAAQYDLRWVALAIRNWAELRDEEPAPCPGG